LGGNNRQGVPNYRESKTKKKTEKGKTKERGKKSQKIDSGAQIPLSTGGIAGTQGKHTENND